MDHNNQISTTHQQKEDDISLIKAAAWAWSQRGSVNSDPKPESELARTRPATTPRPTRYRLESRRQTLHRQSLSSTSDLLDLYEIERITRELNELIVGSGKKESGSKVEVVRKGKRVNGLWTCRGSKGDVVEAAVRQRGKPRVVVSK